MAILPDIIWPGKYENLHCAREFEFILNIWMPLATHSHFEK
jgi:hypothetical protein